MEYLFIWLVFPCAAFSIAKGKNSNPNLWGGLGLLLGPFAVLIVAIMENGEGEDQGYR